MIYGDFYYRWAYYLQLLVLLIGIMAVNLVGQAKPNFKGLGECGAYKEKGVPVRIILLYIFNLMFSPMSMYYQFKMGAFHKGFSKNTGYRFLENTI